MFYTLRIFCSFVRSQEKKQLMALTTATAPQEWISSKSFGQQAGTALSAELKHGRSKSIALIVFII
jgi:hypothetical protein